MNEFKNNKDSKLQQLQVYLGRSNLWKKQVDQLKAAVKKQDATIKAKHKEFQTLQLESGMSTATQTNIRAIDRRLDFSTRTSRRSIRRHGCYRPRSRIPRTKPHQNQSQSPPNNSFNK
jgi:hypothetical protein